MVWFEGSVEQAIKICKDRSGLLGIFIRDGSPTSAIVDVVFSDPDLITAVKQAKDLVLLRIVQGSPNYNMLHSVYPVAAVPMLQFIDGANGRLVFSVQPRDKNDVVKGLREGIETWIHQRSQSPHVVSSSASIPALRSATPTRTPENTPVEGSSQDDLETRVRRAQEKAAEIRKRKEKEAEEAQREKDRQRRVEGQLMAQAERERNVNLAEQTRQEIDKEKRQDAEHRQKILQQLREDQEERDRRAQSARAITSTKDLPAVNKPPEVSASGIDYNKSKIQFRHETAEGMRNFVGVFEATDPLGVAFDFAKGETGLKGEITFLQMYPRKDFTKSDAKTTLRLLGLVPNAVLMIVLADGGKRTLSTSASAGLLNSLMTNVIYLIKLPLQGANMILAYLFPPRNRGALDGPLPGVGRPSLRGGAGDPRRGEQDAEVRRRRPEEPTYNGNSTQQL